jgi:hypothetical protein
LYQLDDRIQHEFYTAPNPPLGAVFTYYLKKELKTRAKTRQDAEKDLIKKNADADAHNPSWDEMKRELREEAPTIVLTVRQSTDRDAGN